MDSQTSKQSAALLSVLATSLLVVGKLVIGLVVGSVSVVSEAIHSALDLVAAGLAFVSVRKSGKPADQDHPYGHGKVENVSGLIEALLILVAAGWVIYEAVRRLLRPEPLVDLWLAVAVMAVSALVNFVVSQRLLRVAQATESIALEADAWHLRTDVYTSAGVMLGLVLLGTLSTMFPAADFHWLDPVAAIAVALLILRAAVRLIAKAVRDLLDERLPEREEDWLRACILDSAPEVIGFHRLRTRRSGSSRFVDVHVQVPGLMSVTESHRIADLIEQRMRVRFPGISVVVHIEPETGDGSHHD